MKMKHLSATSVPGPSGVFHVPTRVEKYAWPDKRVWLAWSIVKTSYPPVAEKIAAFVPSKNSRGNKVLTPLALKALA